MLAVNVAAPEHATKLKGVPHDSDLIDDPIDTDLFGDVGE